MRTRPYAISLLAAAAAAMPLEAQSLSDRVAEMVRFGSCGQALCLTTGAGLHGTHYIDAAASANQALVDFLTNAITVSVGSIPISATSSGTTFRFVGGAPVQTSTSAGPIFAERGTTLGRGRALLGVNTTRIAYSELRGVKLSDLDVNLAHIDVGTPGLGNPAFESDVVNIGLDLDLDLQVTSLFATYGLTDNIDVSVAVPLVSSSLRGRSVGSVVSVAGTPSGDHFFGTIESPRFTESSAADGSSTGIGDIAARVKLGLPAAGRTSLAVLGDVRLPTGDEDDFHGSGSLAARILGVASARFGAFSPHLNAGYALRTGDDQPDAVLVTAGFDQLVASWATLAVDLLSEWQVGDEGPRLPQSIAFTVPNQSIAGTNIPDERDDLLLASFGGRFNVRAFSIVANGLVPLNDAGVSSNFVWTLGIERSF